MTWAAEARSGKSHRDENFPVASRLIHQRHRATILAFYRFIPRSLRTGSSRCWTASTPRLKVVGAPIPRSSRCVAPWRHTH